MANKKNANAESSKFLYENINFGAKEAFRRLRTNAITSVGEGVTCPVIGVTSSHPGEGKSIISLNFAFSLAELGKKVLIIDADMFRPSLHTKLGMDPSVGLFDLLGGNNDLGSAIKKYTCSEQKLELDVIFSSVADSNEASEMITSKRMSSLLTVLKKAYDYIVIDFPPVGSVSDVAAVSKRVDGMVFVVRENHCTQAMLRESVEQLKFSGAKILGFVVNGSKSGTKGYGYGYGYGKYGYGDYYGYN